MAAIPGTRRFYHFTKIVDPRADINVEKAKKGQCALLVVDEILEKEHTFSSFFQGIELDDVNGVGFKSFKTFPKVDACASEIMRGEAVVWIPQQQGDAFVNLRSADVI